MALATPPRVWWRVPGRTERIWLLISVIFLIVVFVSMPVSLFVAAQNTPNEHYRVTPDAYLARATAFIDRYRVGTENGIPVVRPPAGDVYLIAQQWQWRPILILKSGQTYRLHLSSLDVQHGFSLLPMSMNFQVVPGYETVLVITPSSNGLQSMTYSVICNQFCGLGHHQMSGKIVVEG
jgi:cytochrome c oxidase subunit 2